VTLLLLYYEMNQPGEIAQGSHFLPNSRAIDK